MDESLVDQMTQVLRERGLVAACDRCGTPIVRRRRVRSDQPHYCDACRTIIRRESTRLSVAKHRANKRRTTQ